MAQTSMAAVLWSTRLAAVDPVVAAVAAAASVVDAVDVEVAVDEEVTEEDLEAEVEAEVIGGVAVVGVEDVVEGPLLHWLARERR